MSGFFKSRAIGFMLVATAITAASVVVLPAANAALPPPSVSAVAVKAGGVRGGTHTVLVGRNFTGTTKVLFGTVPGTRVQLLAPYKLSVYSPAHAAGAVHLLVVTNHGTSAKVLADEFRYIPPPTVKTVTNLRPGQRASVTGGPFLNVNKVTIAGQAVPFTVVNSGLLTATVPSLLSTTTSTVPVQVNDAYGLSPTFPAFVVSPPRISATVASVAWDVVKLAIAVSSDPNSRPVSWDAIQIERTFSPANGAMSSTTVLAELPPNASSYVDTTVQPNSSYSYAAEPMLNGVKEYPYSGVGAKTPAAPGAPLPPTSASATLDHPNEVTINWSEPKTAFPSISNDNFSSIMVRRTIGSTPPTTPTGGVLVTNSTAYSGPYLDTGIAPNTTYTYAIFAMSAGGSWSSPVDQTITTPGAGVGWDNGQLIDHGFGSPTAISCASSSMCVATDDFGGVVSYNGSTWTVPVLIDPKAQSGGTSSKPYRLSSVSCASATFCVAADTSGDVYRYDGSAWTAPLQVLHLGGSYSPYTNVSCGSPTFCVVSFDGNSFAYNGTTWSPLSGPPVSASNFVSALECHSDGTCDAGTTDGNHFRFNGSGWSGAQATGTRNGVQSIACPTATSCVAVSGAGELLSEVGGAWTTPVPTSANDVSLGSVSCSSPTWCDAVAVPGPSQPNEYAASLWRWNGSTWGPQIKWDHGAWDASVSCLHGGNCYALDSNNGNLGIDDGVTTPTPTPAEWFSGSMYAGSCALSGTCVTVDANSTFTGTNGTFGPHTAPPQTRFGIASMSCASASFCAAVDTGDQLSIYTNGAWGAPQLIGPDTTTTRIVGGGTVSCASPTLCLAFIVGTRQVLQYDGVSWHPPTNMPALGPSTFSCADSMCMLENTYPSTASGAPTGGMWKFDGTTWTDTAASLPNDPVYSGDISCASATFCMVTMQYGAMVWNGDTWSQPPGWNTYPRTDVAGTGYSHLACASESLCLLASGYNDQVWAYDGTRWYQYPLFSTWTNIVTIGCSSSRQCELLTSDSGYTFNG